MRRIANRFGGWSQQFDQGGSQVWVIVKRGRYTRKIFGKRCWEWSGSVIRDGKVLWSGKVLKRTSAVKILQQAGVHLGPVDEDKSCP